MNTVMSTQTVQGPLADRKPAGALMSAALRLGDDCLILGQNISRWIAHTPVLEEDIAQANIALDLIGQARLWLALAGDLGGDGSSADDLAYWRQPHEFCNLLLLELPNGDYGRTLMRQYLFDEWHRLRLQALGDSAAPEIAGIAGKAVKEVTYHVERSGDLVVALGDGSDESHSRMQQALDALWMYTGEMFMDDDVDRQLHETNLAGLPSSLKQDWHKAVSGVLARATLKMPDKVPYMQRGGRAGIHSEHLGYLLAEMQVLQRSHPGATW